MRNDIKIEKELGKIAYVYVGGLQGEKNVGVKRKQLQNDLDTNFIEVGRV